MQPEINEIPCPHCASEKAVKYGKLNKKMQNAQKYKCKSCQKIFTLQPEQQSGKTYNIKVVLTAVSLSNLGHSQTEVASQIARRFKAKPSQKTISNWLSEFKGICTFSNLRDKAIKLHRPSEIIHTQTLNHIQPYTFKFHKAKLYLLFHDIKYNNQFHNIAHFYEPLKAYLEKISTKDFPHHIFTYNKSNLSSPDAEVDKNKNINNKNLKKRASQIKFNHLKIEIKDKNNFACKLAGLALNLANSNKGRHQVIQNFFLINDSTTIAIEVPVYLTNWDAGYYRNQKGFIFPLNNYKTPITGHIDILQIRNGLIYILDYKPDAKSINPIGQLTIYALALSRKLNLPLYYFKGAWFDENSYFEFFPLHAVYEKER